MSAIIFPASPDPVQRMHPCGAGNYWFYHRGTYPSDPPLMYQTIVDAASDQVDVWDPYFNVHGRHRDPDIFINIQPGLTIRILTQKDISGRTPNYLADVENAMRVVIPASKNVRFGMRVIDSNDPANSSHLVHDRLLIVDRSQVYLVGSSVGYYLQPVKSTGFYKVSDNLTNQFIISVFNSYWNHSPANEIPVRYIL